MKTIKQLGLALCALGLVTGFASGGEKPPVKFENAFFYDAGGKFLPEKAKDAVISLMQYHGYPVYPGVREKLWVSDYGTGQFAKLGLAAVMFANNTNDHYMVMDLYLLPNQMLPEHWHTSVGQGPVKLEGWLIRHGLSHVVGEGAPNLGKDIVIPPCHANGTVTVKHETLCGPGEWAQLNRAEAHHWMLAGPVGAILTEVANGHENEAVRHFDKAINDHFLGKQ